MRDFLDAILAFIGADSLTDIEFATVTSSTLEYSQTVYDELSAILQSRELVTSTHDRLGYYFKARGVDISEASTAKSNIFMGAEL